jgi:D-arabinose 1-dehydrogenase-like Zn-dependent alcohol dehydrogenase
VKRQITQSNISSGNSIRAARIHRYNSPLIMDDIKRPVISSPGEVVVRVGAAGLCHSDLHLIDGLHNANITGRAVIIP